MDPTAQTTLAKKIPKNVLWIYLLAVLLAIAFGISSYFIGFERASSKKSAVAPTTKTPPGFDKAQNNIELHSELLTLTLVTQNYSGKLISFIPEKSWTLTKSGRTVTIRNEAKSKITYYIRPNGPTAKTQLTDKAPFKIGDEIIISTFIRAYGDAFGIDKITLVLPPPVPTPITSSSPPQVKNSK